MWYPGDPRRDSNPRTRLRRPALYPTELRGHDLILDRGADPDKGRRPRPQARPRFRYWIASATCWRRSLPGPPGRRWCGPASAPGERPAPTATTAAWPSEQGAPTPPGSRSTRGLPRGSCRHCSEAGVLEASLLHPRAASTLARMAVGGRRRCRRPASHSPPAALPRRCRCGPSSAQRCASGSGSPPIRYRCILWSGPL